MFSFHTRNRSLIPVKDMEISEKMALLDEEGNWNFGREEEEENHLEGEVEETDLQTSKNSRNLTMVYLLFLAEAIMASSLSTQVHVLVPSATACVGVDTSFLRSILQCAYFLGCTAGIFWGVMVDAWGRRKIALLGLGGMCACCLSMGFATTLPAFAVLRFAAGVVGSAVTVSGLSMLADITHGCSGRARVVACLPVVALGGSLGPLAAQMVRKVGEGAEDGVLARFPGLSAQVACAGLVSAIAIAEAFMLQETLSQPTSNSLANQHSSDPEKASFLATSHSNSSASSLSISIIDDALPTPATATPSRLTLTHLLTAPSILLLLSSYSLLTLHTSTFSTLLPHLSHTPAHAAGLSIPCSALPSVRLAVSAASAVGVLYFIPRLTAEKGALGLYRATSLVFPGLYVAIPVLSLVLTNLLPAPTVLAVFNTVALLVKSTLTSASSTLVLLLLLSAAPDANSTGTLIGTISLSNLFKSLATGAAGVAFYLSDDYEVVVVNGVLWAGLVGAAVVGGFVAWRLRGKGAVGMDFPEEAMVWEGVFDAESEDEGFEREWDEGSGELGREWDEEEKGF